MTITTIQIRTEADKVQEAEQRTRTAISFIRQSFTPEQLEAIRKDLEEDDEQDEIYPAP